MSPRRSATPWRALLAAGRRDGRLVREAFVGARAARHTELPTDLHPSLLRGLNELGIDKLYSHQAQAWEAAADGPFVVTTGTASGKSLCFTLPTLDILLTDPMARALYLAPTKALARDQLRTLAEMKFGDAIRPAVYSGDTPREQRTQIRKRSNIVLTNPDMLHVGILPNHHAWATFFSHLAVVVVDEAHVYRGVFGSHVANVLRRLRRIASAYGALPRFLLASATIANPVALSEDLTGLDDIVQIDEDGSPGARRQIAIWNPPLEDEQLGSRRSVIGETADVLTELVCGGARTICFVKSRKAVELVAQITSTQLAQIDGELAGRVSAYRAGYTAKQRQEIERKLIDGRLRCVVTTDALELGIDIGALDASVVVTFPGTIASLRQMWGRAGRRGEGLALYIAGEDALDQFFCRHPDEFIDRPVEAAFVNYENDAIHSPHLLCAAYEGPIAADASDERTILGPRLRAHCEHLAGRRLLRETSSGFVPHAREAYPAGQVSLRSGMADSFSIVDLSLGEIIGTVEATRAFTTVHEGAIYLHMGDRYRVEELDVYERRALVAPSDEQYYTQPKTQTDTLIERLLDRRDCCGVTLSFGIVSVSETVIAYQRKRLADHSVVDLRPLDLPTTTFSTQALWYEPSHSVLSGLEGDTPLPATDLLGALHATEHAQIAVLPLLAMCDRWDIGGLSTNLHPQTSGPTIFIYDGHPGGVGITRQAFTRFERLVADAHRMIVECPCQHGCPSCVQSPKCGNLNEPLAKNAAAKLLARLLALRETTQ